MLTSDFRKSCFVNSFLAIFAKPCINITITINLSDSWIVVGNNYHHDIQKKPISITKSGDFSFSLRNTIIDHFHVANATPHT
jgi:hypothetical protein